MGRNSLYVPQVDGGAAKSGDNVGSKRGSAIARAPKPDKRNSMPPPPTVARVSRCTYGMCLCQCMEAIFGKRCALVVKNFFFLPVYIVASVFFLIAVIIGTPYLFAVYIMMDHGQKRYADIVFLDWIRQGKGEMLEIKNTPNKSSCSDIQIPTSYVSADGKWLNTATSESSLRRSLDMTVSKNVLERRLEYSKNAPRYFLCGWHEQLDLQSLGENLGQITEIWGTAAHVASLATGMVFSAKVDQPRSIDFLSQRIFIDTEKALQKKVSDAAMQKTTDDEEEVVGKEDGVLGYMYLMWVSDDNYHTFYSDEGPGNLSQVATADQSASVHRRWFQSSCTAVSDPLCCCRYFYGDTAGKIIARSGYPLASFFNIFEPFGAPLAYVFNKTSAEKSKLKIVHTYRVMSPHASIDIENPGAGPASSI